MTIVTTRDVSGIEKRRRVVLLDGMGPAMRCEGPQGIVQRHDGIEFLVGHISGSTLLAVRVRILRVLANGSALKVEDVRNRATSEGDEGQQ